MSVCSVFAGSFVGDERAGQNAGYCWVWQSAGCHSRPQEGSRVSAMCHDDCLNIVALSSYNYV